MTLTFDAEIWTWRGPAPYHFVAVPEAQSRELKEVAGLVTYGWGMVPATVRIGKTEWTTSLWPKNGGYVVPLKDRVRLAEALEVGETVRVTVAVSLEAGA